MTKVKVFVLSGALFLTGVGVFAQSAPTISIAVSGPQLATANGTPNAARPGRMAPYPGGRFLVVDISNTANQRIYIVDPSKNPSTLMKVTDTVALRTRVDMDNGSAPAPQNMSVAAVDSDCAGNVFIATDGADPEIAYLFRVNPTTGAVDLLCGLDSVPSTIEGLTQMSVFLGDAYVVLEANFGAPSGDSIVKISSSAPAGGKTKAAVFASESGLLAGVAPSMELAFRSIWPRPGRMSLVTANSATAGANDDFLELDTATGAVSVLVRATDIETKLRVDDIGQSSFHFGPEGAIYMVNQFGTPANVAPDKSIVRIANPNAGTGDATVFATQAQIVASPLVRDLNGNPVTTVGFNSGEGIVVLAENDVVLSDTNSRNVIRIKR